MAVDYKTLHAMAVTRATDADGYCPECGQPVGRLIRWSSRQATSRVWWPWILAALGLYLAVAFGVEAWGAQRLAAVRLEDLRQVAAWCTDATGVDPRCADLASERARDRVLARLARYTAAEGEARRDLAVAAVGALAALTGVAAATRPLAPASNAERRSEGVRAAQDILALGASAMLPGAQLLLAASGSLAIARLLQGAPPSGQLVAGSVHRTIELIVAVVQNA